MKKLSFYKHFAFRVYAVLHDVIAIIVAWVLAFALRFNFDIPSEFYRSIYMNGFWVAPIFAAAFVYFGLYKGVWRFASLPDLKRIITAVVVASLLIIACKVFFTPRGVIPRTVLFVFPALLILIMGGSRFLYRYWKDHKLYVLTAEQGKPVFVLGAGETAINLVKELERSVQWRVVGVLDQAKKLHGFEIYKTQVLGAYREIGTLAQQFGVQHAILALPTQAHQARREALQLAKEAGLEVLTVPAFEDLMSGKLSVSQIRKVEVEDLLGRDPVALDTTALIELIANQPVLVTGAAGSIGSELCRQLLKFSPAQLICLDISEYALYQLEQEFSQLKTPTKIHYLVGDVRDEARLEGIFSGFAPKLVLHAAAYKHVPLMENDNVAEALRNNVLGTYQVARACLAHGVRKFVLVSTDKAVNPTNVMGASKRLAELVCQGMQQLGNTTFINVRFGNVLGSSGSVIPKFRAQIAAGGPITVTHPEITRYFMSIPEAAQLVLQAGLMGKGGEVFVLDMGEPIKIVDLAKEMIRLSGAREDDIQITFSGLRPGEKLYEELLADDEHTLPTNHQKLRIAQARGADLAWVESLIQWILQLETRNEARIKTELKTWVEEYQPQVDARVAMAKNAPTLH